VVKDITQMAEAKSGKREHKKVYQGHGKGMDLELQQKLIQEED
jgi:hypothetical protein